MLEMVSTIVTHISAEFFFFHFYDESALLCILGHMCRSVTICV